MPLRTPEEEERQLRKDARHEAGHAVAALHYGCGVQKVSIGGAWPVRGTTRLGVSHTSHAVVLFCGPLAESDWTDFPSRAGALSPTDQELLDYLGLSRDELEFYQAEAVTFLQQRDVREQIDRVADALRNGKSLTVDDVRSISGFSRSLRPSS
jgi:hypothetical protein